MVFLLAWANSANVVFKPRDSDRYGLEMRPETFPGLLERFGLVLGHALPGGWRP